MNGPLWDFPPWSQLAEYISKDDETFQLVDLLVSEIGRIILPNCGLYLFFNQETGRERVLQSFASPRELASYIFENKVAPSRAHKIFNNVFPPPSKKPVKLLSPQVQILIPKITAAMTQNIVNTLF